MNSCNRTWADELEALLCFSDYTPSPRGKETRELIARQYWCAMPAYVDLAARKVNLPFMLAEPAWILSGSNRLRDLTRYKKAYANFSDDGQFLRGAYGPKVVYQLGYAVDSLAADEHSRQAYINIWRERPAVAKDIACTVGMQFLQREGRLHCSVTMRSQDAVQGFTYDVFTFSMIANAVRLLLQQRRREEGKFDALGLGNLIVTAGSFHLYKDPFGRGDDQFAKAARWMWEGDADPAVGEAVERVMEATTFDELLEALRAEADERAGVLSFDLHKYP